MHLLFCFGVFKCFVKFWSFLDFVKQAETGGGGALSATPPKWLNGFQWNFPEFFYTYCRFGPPILFWFFKIVCQILVIFGLCQTSWKGGGVEHYPQLLLNGWIDFNETFQNSFTHIANVHLLFCFWIISFFVKLWSILDFVKQAETGGGGIIRNSS